MRVSTPYIDMMTLEFEAFHLVRTHLGGGAAGGEGEVKSPIHFHCVLHMQKRGWEGVQIACKIAYVLNGRPLSLNLFDMTEVLARDRSIFHNQQGP